MGVQDDPLGDHDGEALPDGRRPGEDPAGATPGPDEELPFAGALGVDPDLPDPGCEHDWRNLHFLEDDEGIVCGRCRRLWEVDDTDARDTVLTLWQSTRRAVEELTLRQDRLSRIIEELTGSARCHWCDSWGDDPDHLVVVQRRRVCPEHVGQLLSAVAPVDDDDLEDARGWILSALEENTHDLYVTWLAENAVVECPELAAGPLAIEAIGARSVDIPAAWGARLGVGPRPNVNDLSTAVARLLELPAPTSRAGRAFLIGTLARALWAARLGDLLDAESLTGLLLEAAPSGNRDRATVVLDLYREEMQVDGTVTGEMADDLVEALLGRAGSELAPLVLHGIPGDSHPR